VDEATMRRRLAAARVARLATVRETGEPHLVPCCFAVDGGRIYSVVDAKPKRTQALRRLDNVRANPAVALLVDHYDDDWSTLWWVRVDGRARVSDDADERARAIGVLATKYAQYRAAPPSGPLLVIDIDHWRSWSADT
jgi:PPOX class probable F420-dependent enzyme